MFTVGAMLTEKTSGLLERCVIAGKQLLFQIKYYKFIWFIPLICDYVTGLSLMEIGVGHIILQMLILIIQTAFLMIVLFCIFDNPLSENLTFCLILLLCVGICGMFYGKILFLEWFSFVSNYAPCVMLNLCF